jgi:hypothetical protein
MAYERFEALAKPPSGEPSPEQLLEGATVDEWAMLGGLGEHIPHEVIQDVYTEPLSCEPHHPENIAHTALQRLTLAAVTERRGGLPMRYRPIPRRSDAER